MASYVSAALGAARQWLDQLTDTTNQMEGCFENLEYASHVLLHQINRLSDDIAKTENYYIQVMRLIRIDSGRLHSLRPVELSGDVPQAYFHFPDLANCCLVARAKRAGPLEETEEAREVPDVEIVRILNTDKIHNYILHPDNLVELVEQAMESVKGMELEHVIDCDSIAVEDTD